MTTEMSLGFAVAEMNTHHFMFRGAGRSRETAPQPPVFQSLKQYGRPNEYP